MTATAAGATSIGRLSVRWRVAAPSDGHQPDTGRLDELTAALASDDLGGWEPSGVASGEQVCVRRVTVDPVPLRWDETDGAFVRRWSRAVAAAVEAAVAAATSVPAPGSGQVSLGSSSLRFRSLDAAAVDAVVGILTGDVSRAWAWRQLGLWLSDRPGPAEIRPPAPGEAPALAELVLADRPHLVVPALLAAVERAGGPAPLEVLGADRLLRLVAAAWRRAGGSDSEPPAGAPPSVAARFARSKLAAALASWRQVAGGAGHPGAAAAAARLVVLEVEPALAGTPAATSVVAAVARRMTAGLLTPPEVGGAPSGADRGHGGPADAAHPISIPGAGPGGRPGAGRTRWGGLLFLLHLVADAHRSAGESAGPWPERATLHGAGLDLLRRLDAEVRADDPALLAFGGWPPGSSAPEPLEDEAQLTAARLADGLVEGLSQRVETDGLAGLVDLLDLVCRRDAAVEYEPGWIDVRFELDSVVLEVRRSGLDLDLGFLPGLGCVVRFLYG